MVLVAAALAFAAEANASATPYVARRPRISMETQTAVLEVAPTDSLAAAAHATAANEETIDQRAPKGALLLRTARVFELPLAHMDSGVDEIFQRRRTWEIFSQC